jgi:hypothetical protein
MSSGARSPEGCKKVVMFALKERVDLEACEKMLASAGMNKLRGDCEYYWKTLCNTYSVAKALGGYLPVEYTRPSVHPDFYGRMKADVVADGLTCTPYVRMMRDARAVMAGAYYFDVDMVNCQPTILAQKLAMHNIACPLLDRYVKERRACIAKVQTACGVDGAAAKNLFIRLMYLGGTASWASDYGVDVALLPAWVDDLKTEMRKNADILMGLPELQEFKRHLTFDSPCQGIPMHTGGSAFPVGTTGSSKEKRVATMMAIYLQSAECQCVRALVDAITFDGRTVGGIIYDGVLVEKDDDDASFVDHPVLLRWSTAIQRSTGLVLELAAKELVPGPDWVSPDVSCAPSGGPSCVPADASADGGPAEACPGKPDATTTAVQVFEDLWMKGHVFLTYDAMKARWEDKVCKIVKTGNYIQEDAGERTVFSDKMINDSYKHLCYADFKKKGGDDYDDGSCTAVVVTQHPFIARWTKDPRIKSYKDMVLVPPPMTVPDGVYNIWNGFAVERYGLALPPDAKVDLRSDAVLAYLDFIKTLFGRSDADVEYFLDWVAQIFKQPSVKTGIAVLLVGCEGAGKNRLTDLLRAMLGPKDRFLQTASPANTLYGRFNRGREGKFLVAINESTGSDNFAANEQIKDMITCDEFISEGKGTNSYPFACFARFIFTTNNDNCLKVNPDSRRYFIKEVASVLKGNTEYFKRLSSHIDDEHGRYEFYRFLMARDISSTDWFNDRPVTDYMLTMIDLNLPLEYQFLKETVASAFSRGDPVIHVQLVKLFRHFITWAARRQISASKLEGMNDKKFGVRMSKLVFTDAMNTQGFKGVTKARSGQGIVYSFDVPLVADELVRKRWAAPDELVRLTRSELLEADRQRAEDARDPNCDL